MEAIQFFAVLFASVKLAENKDKWEYGLLTSTGFSHLLVHFKMGNVCRVYQYIVLWHTTGFNHLLTFYLHIQNVYCKRGYFCWGEILQKCWQDISRGGNFHDTTPISYIKAYTFYFYVGVIFAKKITKARKKWKLLLRKNFHVCSTCTCMSIFTLNIVLWQKPKGLNYYYILSTICSLGITN